MTKKDAELFWLSLCMLFFELMVIRWLSSELRIFAYFHNLVLLFCFFGIGLGCALCRRRIMLWVPFVAVAAFAVALWVAPYAGYFSIRKISIYLSAATGAVIWEQGFALSNFKYFLAWAASLAMLMLIIGLITACFIPFGQLLGRMLEEAESPLRAYGVNLGGSLAGIVVFTVLSAYSTPPPIWLLLGGAGTLYFLLNDRKTLAVSGAAVLIAAGAALAMLIQEKPTY